jgi:hypothetical protein
MPDAMITRKKLDLGRVVSLTFGAIGGNFVTFTVLVLLFATLPTVAIEYVAAEYFASWVEEFRFSTVVLTAIEAIPVALATGAITQGAILHFDGRQATLGDCLATGIRLFLPLLGVSVLTTLGMAVGGMLFVVPGILIALTLAVATPALVVERLGVFEALLRSSTLTKGSRWGILGLGAAYIVAFLLISLGAGYVIGTTAQLSGEESLVYTPLWLTLIIVAVATTLSTLLASAGGAALYYELRTMKEGASSSQLAEVFV